MTPPVRYTGPAQEQLLHALAQRLGCTTLARATAVLAMEGLGSLHGDAALDVAYILVRVEALVNLAASTQPLTPEQQAALDYCTRRFLDDVLASTQDAAAELLDTFIQNGREV